MKEVELKPCPFCGGKDLVFRRTYVSCNFAEEPKITCQNCHFTIPGCIVSIPGEDKKSEDFSDKLFIKWWNRRAGDQDK